MSAPLRRLCRGCGRLDTPEAMVRLGTSESRPGWCGGPRQGGRALYAHQACIDADAARNAAAAAEAADRTSRAQAYLAECRTTGAEPTTDRMAELLGLA